MDRAEWLAGVNGAGEFQRVAWVSEPTPAAAHRNAGVRLRKEVSATVRTGVDYARLGVNAGVETGELPWGTWLLFPYLIVHKGTDYARLYVWERHPVAVAYFVDGVEVDRATFEGYLTPSARGRSLSTGGCITVKLDSLAFADA